MADLAVRLIDHIIQCRAPFIVENNSTRKQTRLSGAMEGAAEIQCCPIRYVLDDALTGLCTDLAYSKGTNVLACVDLIRIPAERVWVEWCEMPWRQALLRNGFKAEEGHPGNAGRRGVLLRSSADGLRGSIRSYWNTGHAETDIFASAMEAHFYLDASSDMSADRSASADSRILWVEDKTIDQKSVLRRCFHFAFEKSWGTYYDDSARSTAEYRAIQLHSIGAIAIAVPVLLAFFLLLGTRSGLPQRSVQLDRLNRTRTREGRAPLLDHIEVSSPVLPEYRAVAFAEPAPNARRASRLHHVRGHLVRRANQLFWRVPHLRGSAHAGVLKSRTVIWRFDAKLFPAVKADRWRQNNGATGSL